jgi:hypothetical protein
MPFGSFSKHFNRLRCHSFIASSIVAFLTSRYSPTFTWMLAPCRLPSVIQMVERCAIVGIRDVPQFRANQDHFDLAPMT